MAMSNPRPLFRPPSARILIALLAIAIGSASLAPAATGAGPGSKASHLDFRLYGQTRQDVVGAKAIALVVHCPSDACKVTVWATSQSPPIRTAAVHAHVPSGGSQRLAVPISVGESRKLRTSFKAGRHPTLTVHALARDAAGDKVPLTLQVSPTKP